MTPVQTAIFARLEDELLVPVYDRPPQPDDAGDDESFPYITIGDDTFTPWDDDLSQGYEAELNVHTWTRYRGRKELKELQQMVYDALHRYQLTITGYATINLSFEFADSVRDPDGLTHHGVSRFRLLIEDQRNE